MFRARMKWDRIARSLTTTATAACGCARILFPYFFFVLSHFINENVNLFKGFGSMNSAFLRVNVKMIS